MDPLGLVKGPIEYPLIYEVLQKFDVPALTGIDSAVACALDKSGAAAKLKPGARIAVTAGSRGIRNNVAILRAAVAWLKAHGAEPFVVSAMGSHGGGNARGQVELLESLGVNGASVGCRVVTSDDVTHIGTTKSGHMVYCDTPAWESDGILAINRVKPHTSFRGPIESGVCKILAVGLGKAAGATYVHLLGAAGMAEAIPAMASVFLETGKVIAGVAVLENALDETAEIVGLDPEAILDSEPGLLERARAMMASLPVDKLDLLVVGEMGKNYSGTGMDTNVLGRYQLEGLDDPESPRPQRIVVLDLSEESHGNATGIGLADVVTTRLTAKYDRKPTYLNCLTSTFLHRAAIPPAMDNDWAAMGLAVKTCGQQDSRKLKLMMIKNTLHVERVWVSETILGDLKKRPYTQIVGGPFALQFDSDYNLVMPYLR